MSSGKRKGSKSERDIARFLTEWLTGQKKELYFWRSPGSGQLSTINLGNKSISGDIMALKPESAFVTDFWNIEVKDGYEDIDIFQYIKGNKGFKLLEFWDQCTRDAKDNDKLPLLLYRRTRGRFTASICDKGRKILGKKLTGLKMVRLNFDIPLYMFDRDEFFEKIKPEDIKNEV